MLRLLTALLIHIYMLIFTAKLFHIVFTSLTPFHSAFLSLLPPLVFITSFPHGFHSQKFMSYTNLGN